MKKANLEVVKNVIEKSKLPNRMVAEAFGYDNEETLNIEFLDSFGMTVAEFRQRCKAQTEQKNDDQADVG